MSNVETKTIDKLTYEEAFAELEKIVAALESGDQTLEEALSLFEHGQRLSKHCTELLARAELRVQELSGEKLEALQEGE
jgi:exodeoxyribonuclease VII small subunit